MADSVEVLLGRAVQTLVSYIGGRRDGGSEDDDVQALEDVAYVLQQALPSDRIRLRELIGEEIADALGLN